MGGARFMGRDEGTTYTKGEKALEHLIFWIFGGGVASFGLFFIVFPNQRFLFPILFYVFWIVIFSIRCLRIDKREVKNEKRISSNL